MAEVCGTAIETMINVTVKLTVLKDKSYVKTPHFFTPHVPEDPKGYYCTTGVAPGERFLFTTTGSESMSDCTGQISARLLGTLSAT